MLWCREGSDDRGKSSSTDLTELRLLQTFSRCSESLPCSHTLFQVHYFMLQTGWCIQYTNHTHVSVSVTCHLQNAIARGAATRRKISEEVWLLFTAGSPSEVVLPNCTALNEAAMLKGIKEACTLRCFPACASTPLALCCNKIL